MKAGRDRDRGAIDRAVLERAGRRNRVVTWQDLRGAGLAPNSIAHRVTTARLHRIHRGVYLLDDPTVASRVTLFTAAVTACGEGAILSHRSAAELWGLLRCEPGELHVTVVGRNPGERRRGIVIHRPAVLHGRDLRSKQGVPVTSPTRTALDLAASLTHHDLERVLATARVERLANDRELAAALLRYPTHPGAAKFGAVLRRDGGPALTRSDAESLLLSLIRKARLPVPLTNARVRGYEVDLVWPQQHLIVEVDGFAFHGDRAAFERDRERDAALVAAGFRVIRVTWRMLIDQPMAVIAQIAAALAIPV